MYIVKNVYSGCLSECQRVYSVYSVYIHTIYIYYQYIVKSVYSECLSECDKDYIVYIYTQYMYIISI